MVGEAAVQLRRPEGRGGGSPASSVGVANVASANQSTEDRRNRRNEDWLRNAATSEAGGDERAPERVQEALGELAGATKEGFLALSVGVG